MRRLLHPRRSPPPSTSIARFIHGGAGAPSGRDRGLDHAVERERHLRPLLALKDLLIRRGFPSLPLSSISAARSRLRLPFRAARFVRAYPSAFQEFTPPSDGGGGFASLRPHVRPTPDVLRLHEEERGVYAESRAETADRLLKLLMLTRRKRLPIDALEGLKWDLGLPDDYARSLLPDYPDYFQVVPSESADHGPLDLELVCWIKDLAVSALEEKSESEAALAFPLHFTSGFEPEKKLMRRIEEWQRLPYISPYEEGGARLDPKGDQHEKWAVGVLHEVLHLMVSKKCEKWDLLRLGEHLGPKSAVFKRAVASHTGIFYVSHKNRTKVVLLREAYRRDRLLVEHPLVGVRYRYVHLMRKNSGGANDKREEPLHEEEEEEERGDLLEDSNDSDDYVDDDDDDDDDDDEEVEIVGDCEKVNQSDHMDSIKGQLRKSKSTHRSISRRRDIRRKVEHNAGSLRATGG